MNSRGNSTASPASPKSPATAGKPPGRTIRPLRDVLPKAHWGFSSPPVAAAEALDGVRPRMPGQAGEPSGDQPAIGQQGRGAHIDPHRLAAVIGCPPGLPNPPVVHPDRGPLVDFHGHVIGQWWIATQLITGETEADEYPIVMDVGGRRYSGKGGGIGRVCEGHRIPSQKALAVAEAEQYAAVRRTAP